MRVAFFSPLPPCRSGIADYSETLIEHLNPLVELEVFSGRDRPFDPAGFDVALFHLGNNPYHDFVYETAARHPGVLVMHESNLHHLIADLTIKRNDWDGYLRECEYEGGAAALAYARRVRALEIGPDYEGVPMTRRILESARGVIVHSRFMVERIRASGFKGPVARVPHGAWIPQTDRNAWRYRLGLDEDTPLIGIFGFLKPYKRIPESLRAFRRLLRVMPAAKMILVGEPHPDFQVTPLIRSLGIEPAVRVMGYTTGEEFTGYMGACDIVLNLRYPTVGESSGSLLRALGLGRPVLVSDVGAFAEFPEGVCLKVPVGAGEEDLIFEYLNLLTAKREVAREIGGRAARFVRKECNWDRVACLYASFLRSVVERGQWIADAPEPKSDSRGAGAQEPNPVEPADITSWAANEESREYLDTHLTRLEKTLEITPAGGPEDRILEMGAYLQITPALRSKLGYGSVRGCYYGPAGTTEHRTVVSADGEAFECEMDLFDAEKDTYPYPDGYFTTVLCCELIEHLTEDPMGMMSEINRILKPGGDLVLTTPNIASLRGIAAMLVGYHPGIFSAYIRPRADGEVEARHNREYTPQEIRQLLENCGFSVTRLETGPFREIPRPEDGWVLNLLERFELPTDLRGEDIYAVGRKTGGIRERYPNWLYA